MLVPDLYLQQQYGDISANISSEFYLKSGRERIIAVGTRNIITPCSQFSELLVLGNLLQMFASPFRNVLFVG